MDPREHLFLYSASKLVFLIGENNEKILEIMSLSYLQRIFAFGIWQNMEQYVWKKSKFPQWWIKEDFQEIERELVK